MVPICIHVLKLPSQPTITWLQARRVTIWSRGLRTTLRPFLNFTQSISNLFLYAPSGFSKRLNELIILCPSKPEQERKGLLGRHMTILPTYLGKICVISKARRWGSDGNQVAWEKLISHIACRSPRTGPDLCISLPAPAWHTTEIQ